MQIGADNLTCSFQCKTTTKDRKSSKNLLFTRRQHLPGMIENGSQAAVTCRYITLGGSQNIQILLQLSHDLST